MATKNTAKITGMFNSLFKKPEQKSVKDILESAREKEKLLISKMDTMLSAINYDPNIKLSAEKIAEYKIKNRIARMRRSLETPLVTEYDCTELYDQILNFADSLKLALEQGHEQAAYWSSMALHKTVETLRVDTPELYARDPEMKEALYQNKLAYAQSFYNIIQTAIEVDRLTQERSEHETDYKNKARELQARASAYKALLQTAEGKALLAEVNAKKPNLASMTPEEQNVVENEKRIDTLRGLLTAGTALWESVDTELTTRLKSIEMIRLELLRGPDVKDSRLAAKIEESGKRFRERLTSRLDDAYIEMTAIDRGIVDFEALLNHPANRAKWAKIAESLSQLENEWLTTAMAKQEAYQSVIRKASDMSMIDRDLQELQQALENLQEELYAQELQEAEAETEVHQEVETEEEVLEEYV